MSLTGNKTFLVMTDEDEAREYTWAELFPSVFDRDADYKPLFKALGNEQGNWRIDIRWTYEKSSDGRRGGMIVVNTVDPAEQDIDVIEDHQTFIRVWEGGREAFRLAYSVARELVAGKLLPAHITTNDVSHVVIKGVKGISIEPSRHHVAEAA